MAPLQSRTDELHGRGINLFIISILFVFTAAILVGTRFNTRRTLGRKVGLDDWVILFSLIFSIALTVCDCIGVNYGSGKDQSTLPPDHVKKALQAFWVNQIMYKFTINLTKTSICLLYLRIFTTVKWFRIAVKATMALVISYAAASIVATIFECTPVARFWDHTLQGTCIDLTEFWYANASFNLLTDFAILLLPMKVVWELHIPKAHKAGLLMIFGLGTFVCITSILRMTTLNTSSKSKNQTFGNLNSTIWTTIEANTGIICACLPMLKGPLSTLLPRCFPQATYITYGEGSDSAQRRGELLSARHTSPTKYDDLGKLKDPKSSLAARMSAHGTIGYPTSSSKLSTNNSSNANIGMDVDDVPLGRIAKTTNVKVHYANVGGPGPMPISHPRSDPNKPVTLGFSPPS